MRNYNFFQPPKLIQQDENDVDQSKVIKCMTEFYEKRHKIVGTEEAIVSSHRTIIFSRLKRLSLIEATLDTTFIFFLPGMFF